MNVKKINNLNGNETIYPAEKMSETEASVLLCWKEEEDGIVYSKWLPHPGTGRLSSRWFDLEAVVG